MTASPERSHVTWSLTAQMIGFPVILKTAVEMAAKQRKKRKENRLRTTNLGLAPWHSLVFVCYVFFGGKTTWCKIVLAPCQ